MRASPQFQTQNSKQSMYFRWIAFVSVLTFFLIFLVGWLKGAGTFIYGLYSETDGQVFAWISKAMIEWSGPFDTLSLNPFQSMGTAFLPYSPWWNPGALAMLLPLNAPTNYIVSYTVYWVELVFSLFLLSRTIGLTKIESILVPQVFLLFLFPVFTAYSKIFPLLSLAPIFVHLTAVANLMLVLYIKLELVAWLRNIILILFLLFGCFIFISSGSFFVIPYAVVYAFICLGLMLDYHNRRSLFWKVMAIIVVGCVLLALGVSAYYQNVADYVARSLQSPEHLISFAIPKLWQKYNFCVPENYKTNFLSVFCPDSTTIAIFYIFSFLGALTSFVGGSRKHRWLACNFFVIMMIPDVLVFLLQNRAISGRITTISLPYYFTAAQPFYSIFFVLFFSCVMRMLKRLFDWLSSKRDGANSSCQSLIISTNIKAFLVIMIIPTIAIYIWLIIQKSVTPFKKPELTTSVEYLREHISIKPGGVFRGSSASYFAGKNSPLREILLERAEAGENLASSQLFIDAYYYVKQHYNNIHVFTDLWEHNIPTIEEYGQMISVPMMIFFQHLLAEPSDHFSDSSLTVYKLNVNILRALGVRYILTDTLLDTEQVSLILEQAYTQQQQADKLPGKINSVVIKNAKEIFEALQEKNKRAAQNQSAFFEEFKLHLSKVLNSTTQMELDPVLAGLHGIQTGVLGPLKNEKVLLQAENIETIKKKFYSYLSLYMIPPSLYLYEIKNPNLASYSPVKVIQINSVKEIFSKLASPNFSFESTVIVQENLLQNLVKLKQSSMSFEPNIVHVQASSDGWSLVLLPLQYSHCFRLSPVTPNASIEDVRLVRANLVQSALLFRESVDVRLHFEFGIGRNTDCRREDIMDIQTMGVKPLVRINE
jgi:hypothetical protein